MAMRTFGRFCGHGGHDSRPSRRDCPRGRAPAECQGYAVRRWPALKLFDFEKTHYSYRTNGPGMQTWGDREPGRRLLVHARGVGLSLALKRLL